MALLIIGEGEASGRFIKTGERRPLGKFTLEFKFFEKLLVGLFPSLLISGHVSNLEYRA